MRIPLLALALALTACSSADDRTSTRAGAAVLGPDAIVLRIPLSGGLLRAYRYPALDSLLWTSRAALPAEVHPLGFNTDAGTLVMTDAGGLPWRLTLGSGVVERARATAIEDAASLDGTSIFGTQDGMVVRLTPSDATPWQVTSTVAPEQIQPLRDGGVLLIAHRNDDETLLARYRPPGTTPSDTVVLAGRSRLISAAGGDRYYLSDGPRGLLSVRASDLVTVGTISVGDSVIAAVTSPSGDRVYLLGRRDDAVRVQLINKYADEIVSQVEVPSTSSALRMDPLGRYLLVRHGASGDSVTVIAVATNGVVGRLASPWRADLPLVFPDGRLATLRGEDVVVLGSADFRAEQVLAGGARDVWAVVQWNGFRRREGDMPVRAAVPPRPETTAAVSAPEVPPTEPRAAPDSQSIAPRVGRDTVTPSPARDTTARPRSTADSLRRRAAQRLDSVRRAATQRAESLQRASRPPAQLPPQAPTPASAARVETGPFLVQFAALKSEETAKELAKAIKVGRQKARIMRTSTNGTTLYRVILGPYESRADAERAGAATGRDYWVFEGGLD